MNKSIYGELFGIFLSVGIGLYKAWVFMFLFNWFVSPTFNLPEINYIMSFALILTIGVLRIKGSSKASLHYERSVMGDNERLFHDITESFGIFVTLNIVWVIGSVLQMIIY